MTDEYKKIVISGGVVTCIEGMRVWALLDDGREVLILYETAYSKVR